jgi:SAM-dependent methyltransferase
MSWSRNVMTSLAKQPLVRRGRRAVARLRRLAVAADAEPQAVSAQQAYALWAEEYPPRPHNALMRAEQDAVAPLIASTRPDRALDVGTGSGRYLPIITAAGAHVVVGIDLSMPMLTWRARSREALDAAVMAAPLVCGDACRLPFRDGSFDLVNASLMAADIADLAGWVDEMARVLTRGGHLIYSDLHPAWARRGWRRTFASRNGTTLEVPYFAHTLRDHRVGLDKHFEVAGMHEASIVSGASAADRDRQNTPVVIVFHAVRRAASYLRWSRPDPAREG